MESFSKKDRVYSPQHMGGWDLGNQCTMGDWWDSAVSSLSDAGNKLVQQTTAKVADKAAQQVASLQQKAMNEINDILGLPSGTQQQIPLASNVVPRVIPRVVQEPAQVIDMMAPAPAAGKDNTMMYVAIGGGAFMFMMMMLLMMRK